MRDVTKKLTLKIANSHQVMFCALPEIWKAEIRALYTKKWPNIIRPSITNKNKTIGNKTIKYLYTCSYFNRY
jgi:hypothetical protein